MEIMIDGLRLLHTTQCISLQDEIEPKPHTSSHDKCQTQNSKNASSLPQTPARGEKINENKGFASAGGSANTGDTVGGNMCKHRGRPPRCKNKYNLEFDSVESFQRLN